ncbi:MAG TPA: branched-chain amino acid ABC transporter permease [Acidimicrobiia bacterium]|nr:branched-chain amino acid ABC transporter permease [Acidimicrobiia bacterium]
MTPSFVVLAQETAVPNEFAQMLVDGISFGAIYALLAMGFVIIFKATSVLNFAHGALTGLGAFLVAAFATVIDFPGRYLTFLPEWAQWTANVVTALLVAALFGVILERIFLRPMVGEALFAVAIVTLGIDIVVRTITNDFIGTQPRPIGAPWGLNGIDLGWVRISYSEVIQIVVTVALFAAVALFFRSRTGIAMRATAFDQETARAQGINVGRIFSVAWAIGAFLAGVAGLFFSVYPRRATGVDQATAFIAFRAFPAVIIGGLDSIVGAVVGGFTVGIAEAAANVYLGFEFLGSGFPGIVGYLLMMVVLLIRPYGLFGTPEIRRV